MELSEAINSTYTWYEAADVCYAYLCDVLDDDNPFAPDSSFSRSVWHTRGWTLQELLAPQRVVFLSTSWCFIGTKDALAIPLVHCTGINFDALLWPKKAAVKSVAQRMS